MPGKPAAPSFRNDWERPWAVRAVALGIGVIVVAAVGLPLIGVFWQLAGSSGAADESTTTRAFSIGSLVRSVGYCTLIGILATVLGWPAAWSLRRASAGWIALVAVPLLLPSTLAYTGWGLVRGPGSVIGDWLARGSPMRSVIATEVLAVGGLALWAWPIAAFVMATGVRRVPGHLLEALRLEPAGAWTRLGVMVRLVRGEVVAAAGLVALVMAGSAIPLHLAQIDTAAIHLWKYMSLTTNAASVWPAALPLLGVALLGAWVVVRGVDGDRVGAEGAGMGGDIGYVGWARWWTVAVWLLSVAGPLVMFVLHLREWSSLTAFWRLSGGAVAGSLRIAGMVGLICAGLCCGVFAVRTCTAGRGRAMRVSVGAMVFAGLVPGVLVGAATLAFWNSGRIPRWLGSGDVPIVLAHVARFGFLGGVLGWVLARQETADERAARVLAAGESLRGWWALRLVPSIGAVAGVALASAALSFHEIESTVQLATPGSANIAQRLLDLLHYARDEELCAACINLLFGGTVMAFGAGWLVARVFGGNR